MLRYAVKNDYIDRTKVLSILNYDEKNNVFTIDIPDGVSEREVPYIMASFLKKGIRHVDPEWSMRWVKERIIPSSRQNIGHILKANHMERYNEYDMLMLSGGRSCQDEFYLEKL